MKKFFIALLSLAHIVYAIDFSDIDVHIISLGEFDPPVSKLIIEEKDKQEIAKKVRKNQQNVMLLKGEGFNALVDTGYSHTQSTLKEKLQSHGLGFGDITHIIITHAHPDHIGGILNDKGELNFSNALMLIDEREYEFWLKSDNELIKRSLLALKDKKAFFDHSKPLFETQTQVRALAAYGHTPGHNLISIEDTQAKIVFWADLLHVYDVQIQNPDITIAFDNDKQEALKTRKSYLELFKAQNVQVVGSHMPFSDPSYLP